MNLQSSGQFYPVLRAANSLVLMCLALSGMFLSIMILEPVSREFNVGRGQGALPYTLYMIGFSAGNILLGRMMDRYGMAVVAFIGALSLPLGLYIAGTSESFWLFSLGLALFGGLFGGGFAFAPLVADTSFWFERRRGLAVGIVVSGSYLSGAIWPTLLQSWIDSDGWRQATLDLAFFTLITMMPLVLVYLRKPVLDAAGSFAKAGVEWDKPLGFTNGQLQCLICFAGVGCCAAMAMPQIHIVPHALDLGIEARDGATMLALMLGSGIVSRIASGWISDRIGGIKTLVLGSFLQGAVIFAFLFVDTKTGLYIVSIAFGLSQGGIVPSYSIIIRKFFRPGEAGTRIGYAFVATNLGMALGGWMAGALYDLTGNYTLSFINAILFNIMNLGIAMWLLRRAVGAEPMSARSVY